MLSELRRYDNVGDVNGITYFLKLILSDFKMQKEAVRELCALRNDIRLNFNAAVLLVKYLGIINEKAGYLYLTELGKKLTLTDSLDKELCKLCFKKVIVDNLLDISAVRYSVKKNKYVIERYGFTVSAAIFRNILIQYDALREYSGNLIISPGYEPIFVEFQKGKRVEKSLEKLRTQLEQQEIQGAKAEAFVMAYETKRLVNHPKVQQIRQISVIDVSAGYDIISFQSEQSVEYDLFIEVKSYVGNPHFYWSQNEIEISKLYEEKYCIYLVDATRIADLSYEPKIIKNPAKNILCNDSWIMNPTSYMVIPTV